MKNKVSQRLEGSKRQEKRTKKSLSLFVLILLLLMLSFWLQGCQSKTMPQGMQVKVARVLSGQTLEVEDIGKMKMTSSLPHSGLRPASLTPLTPRSSLKVRLVGIDAPDLQQQPWGGEAKQRLEAMSIGKTVLLEFDTQQKDAFGRYLAYVWYNGALLNEQLVKEGYVLWKARSPNYKYDQRLENAGAWAKLMGQGIWNPDRPMRQTPAEFRKLEAKN